MGRELVIYNNRTDEPKSANIYGNDLVGKIDVNGATDNRSYYLKDHLGNIHCVASAEGIVQSAQDYYPYGETLRNYSNNKYLFTEKERDTESTYDYFGARYYDSNLGMWLQVDPLAEKYPGWSPYVYTLCNPMRFIDERGDSVINIDKKQQEDMLGMMNEEDQKQYEEYLNSETVYDFADIYYGWQFINEARKYIDKLEYSTKGETNLEKAADCSGFVWAVMKKFGYKGKRFNTWNIMEDKNFETVTNQVWGDVILTGNHMGFYDPTPISPSPTKQGGSLVEGGTYLSSRTSYGFVQYSLLRWFSKPTFLRIK